MKKTIAVLIVVAIGAPAAVAGFVVYALCHGWNIGVAAYNSLWDAPK